MINYYGVARKKIAYPELEEGFLAAKRNGTIETLQNASTVNM
jgi:hypothetical protein